MPDQLTILDDVHRDDLLPGDAVEIPAGCGLGPERVAVLRKQGGYPGAWHATVSRRDTSTVNLPIHFTAEDRLQVVRRMSSPPSPTAPRVGPAHPDRYRDRAHILRTRCLVDFPASLVTSVQLRLTLEAWHGGFWRMLAAMAWERIRSRCLDAWYDLLHLPHRDPWKHPDCPSCTVKAAEAEELVEAMLLPCSHFPRADRAGAPTPFHALRIHRRARPEDRRQGVPAN